MASSDRTRQPLMCRSSRDVILFQRVGGGWEYRYTSDGATYTASAYDTGLAKTRLKRQLGWDRQRFELADFRRF